MIHHFSLFGYHIKHLTRVWLITSQCLDIRLTLLVFDVLLLDVWISDERFHLVFDIFISVFGYPMKHSFSCLTYLSRCSDIQWNTSSRVWYTTELKQQRRRRVRKSEVTLLQTLFHLFHLVQFIKCGTFGLELNCKIPYRSAEQEKQSRLVLTSSTKREIRHFHVKVVQWQQTHVQKSVMHVQSYIANLSLLLFWRFRWRRRCRCLSSLLSRTWLDMTKAGVCPCF